MLAPNIQVEKAPFAEAFANFREQYGISDKFDDALFFRTLYDRFHGVHSRRVSSLGSRIYVLSGIAYRG
jgi:hypothetical protein